MSDAPVVQSRTRLAESESHSPAETEARTLSGAPYQYIVLHQSCLDHPGVIAVHAAHAAGESCFEGPAPTDTRLVVLVAKDSEDIDALGDDLTAAGIRHTRMIETDGIRAGQTTALGTMPRRDRDRIKPFFSRFRLLR